MILPTVLKYGAKEISVPMLLDSGADSCFLDESLVAEFEIPVVKCKRKVCVSFADGDRNTKTFITHQTVPL
jgi:hypothetical protein